MLGHVLVYLFPWWALADLKTYRFSPSEMQRLDSLTQSGSLSPDHQCQALFTLAKAHEMSSGLREAMPYYKRANTAYPSSRFNPEKFKSAAQNLMRSFHESAIAQQAKPLPKGRKMHLTAANRFSKPFLQSLDLFSEEDLTRFGQNYLDESAVFRSQNTPYFIDKLPHNFEHIGLIHKILPQAIILDIRRNPMDCGLSLFKQFFARGVEFSYKLENIGAYYSTYLNIMSHWDRLLPDRLLHVKYEDLVQDLEQELHIILDHIGVAFEPGCLDFHRSKRAVRTASSEQVLRVSLTETSN